MKRPGSLRRLTSWLTAPLPPPPERLRRGPLRRGAFPSPMRSVRLTSLLGVALAVAFAICLLTGVLSHLIQQPPGWFMWPSRPTGLYRFTQGLHVATGLATVPLLGAKLWSVYPKLFTWPPARTVAHAAERLSVALLVGAALFQVISGVLNVAHWYAPMPFFFTTAHYWVAWLVTGALLIHIGVQLPVIRTALGRTAADRKAPAAPEAHIIAGVEALAAAGQEEYITAGRKAHTAAGQEAPTVAGREAAAGRRQVLTAVGAAAGLITLTTLGQTVRPLAGVSLLAPRDPRTGPQGLPVNRTAAAAGVRDAALDPDYRLVLTGFGRRVDLSLADLMALPQHTAVLPIACVEGWSATGTWSGVRLRDLAALVSAEPAGRAAGADPAGCVADVESLQAGGRYRSSTVAGPHLADDLTLIALRLGGEPLVLDHGYPARLIAPNRPGVMQTKWINRITVRSTR